jgi:hypothetical protein
MEEPSPPQVQARIVAELSKDLLISLFDTFDPFAPPAVIPGSPLALALGNLLGNPVYRRLLQRIAGSADGTPLNTFWPGLGRWGVRSASWVGPAVRTFAAELLALRLPPSSLPTLSQSVLAVHSLGFERIFLLIDSVDASDRTVPLMVHMLEPFFALAQVQPSLLYLKLFAPPEILTPPSRLLDQLPALSPLDVVHLDWTEQRLEAALLRRLHAAGADVESSTSLFVPHDAARLYSELRTAAAGSPRRLFHFISLMIEAHLAAGNQQPGLSYEDWQASQQLISLF